MPLHTHIKLGITSSCRRIVRCICTISLSVLTAISVFYVSQAAVFQTPLSLFPDVSSQYPFSSAISFVYQKGVMKGYPNGNFGPTDTIDRAQLTTIIVRSRIQEDAVRQCTQKSFSDVPTSAWYSQYICAAQRAGIVSGYSDGTFRPGNPVSVVEASKILVLGFRLPVSDHIVSQQLWFMPYVTALVQDRAFPATYLDPDQRATRGEIAFQIQALLEKYPMAITMHAGPAFRTEYTDIVEHSMAVLPSENSSEEQTGNVDPDDPFEEYSEESSQEVHQNESEEVIQGPTSEELEEEMGISQDDENNSQDESSDDLSEHSSSSSAKSSSSSSVAGPVMCKYTTPAINADGSVVAFVAMPDPGTGPRPSEKNQIFISVNGAPAIQITSEKGNGLAYNGEYPQVSPNGRYIAFQGSLSGGNAGTARLLVYDRQLGITRQASAWGAYPAAVNDDGSVFFLPPGCLAYYDPQANGGVGSTTVVAAYDVSKSCTNYLLRPESTTAKVKVWPYALSTTQNKTLVFIAADPGPHDGYYLPGEKQLLRYYVFDMNTLSLTQKSDEFSGYRVFMSLDGQYMTYEAFDPPGNDRKRSVFRRNMSTGAIERMNANNGQFTETSLYLQGFGGTSKVIISGISNNRMTTDAWIADFADNSAKIVGGDGQSNPALSRDGRMLVRETDNGLSMKVGEPGSPGVAIPALRCEE